MWMVDKDGIRDSIDALREGISDSGKNDECIASLQGMIDIKQGHLWRAGVNCTYAKVAELAALLEIEIGMLQNALQAIKQGNKSQANAFLDDFLTFVDKNYAMETPPY